MATICQFRQARKVKTDVVAPPVMDRESEATAIFAAAELAFDRVYRSCEGISA